MRQCQTQQSLRCARSSSYERSVQVYQACLEVPKAKIRGDVRGSSELSRSGPGGRRKNTLSRVHGVELGGLPTVFIQTIQQSHTLMNQPLFLRLECSTNKLLRGCDMVFDQQFKKTHKRGELKKAPELLMNCTRHKSEHIECSGKEPPNGRGLRPPRPRRSLRLSGQPCTP